MNFDFKCTDQCAYLMEDKKNVMENAVVHFANDGAAKAFLIRLSAPVIGISHALFESAVGVANVAETIIKGLGNIFGAAFSSTNKCSLIRGIQQLTVDLVVNVIAAVILIPISLGIGIKTTLKIACHPKAYFLR